jgi:hypothetical protein
MEPKTNNYGKTINIISKQTMKSLIIETPLMDNFGIEDGERNNVHDGKFKIKLTSKKETNSRIGMFLDKMTALDNTLIDAAFTNNWLGVGVTRQEIENRFKPIFNKNNSDNNPANFAFVKALFQILTVSGITFRYTIKKTESYSQMKMEIHHHPLFQKTVE